jgi:hypothetical protein
MGKRTKLRAAQRLAAEQKLAARLRSHVRIRRQRRRRSDDCIVTYWQFPLRFRARIEAFRGLALRSPEDWPCATRDPSFEQRFLNLVRFTFAHYAAALHLERAWLADLDEVGDVAGWPNFRRCYVVAAQGGSPYRECLCQYLSRQESHYFLTAPPQVTASRPALWYAIARVHTEDVAVAISVAHSKLDGMPLAEGFWREVARFFAHHPTSVSEMNDLIDYLTAVRAVEPAFSLAGRSLEALRERMHEWQNWGEYAFHMRTRWSGSALPNATHIHAGEHWRLIQLTSGADLAEEAQRMRHCVHTYVNMCVRGECSIWSLARHRSGTWVGEATIELRGNTIAQVQGFANSAPSEEARIVLEALSAGYGITWSPC